jgi:hypothetical protein
MRIVPNSSFYREKSSASGAQQISYPVKRYFGKRTLSRSVLVAKHRLGPYEPMPVTWLKILNRDYSQKRGRKEMFDKFRDQREPVVASLTPETPVR